MNRRKLHFRQSRRRVAHSLSSHKSWVAHPLSFFAKGGLTTTAAAEVLRCARLVTAATGEVMQVALAVLDFVAFRHFLTDKTTYSAGRDWNQPRDPLLAAFGKAHPLQKTQRMGHPGLVRSQRVRHPPRGDGEFGGWPRSLSCCMPPVLWVPRSCESLARVTRRRVRRCRRARSHYQTARECIAIRAVTAMRPLVSDKSPRIGSIVPALFLAQGRRLQKTQGPAPSAPEYGEKIETKGAGHPPLPAIKR